MASRSSRTFARTRSLTAPGPAIHHQCLLLPTITLRHGCPLRRYHHRWAVHLPTWPADLVRPSSPGRVPAADTHRLCVSSRCLVHSHLKGTTTRGHCQAGTHRRECLRSNRTHSWRGRPRNHLWAVVERGNQGNQGAARCAWAAGRPHLLNRLPFARPRRRRCLIRRWPDRPLRRALRRSRRWDTKARSSRRRTA